MQRQMFRPLAPLARVFSTPQCFAPLAPLSRGFSAAREPLRLHSASGTYAHAVLDLCIEESASPTVVADHLNDWQHSYNTTESLRGYLDDTDVDKEAKVEKLDEELFPQLGLDVETAEAGIAKDLLATAILEDDVPLLPDVVVDFEMLALDHAREVKCIISSAEELSPAHVEKIEAKLGELGEEDETLNVEYRVDPSLLGGLTVQVGSKIQDLSVRSAIMKGEEVLRSM